MKAVMSWWSLPAKNPYQNKRFSRLDLILWSLSSAYAKKHFGSVTLYTDAEGAILFNKFRSVLSFDEVIVCLDDLNDRCYSDINIWSLGKLYVYSKMEEPFIHIDYDLFLRNIPESNFLSAPVFSLHPEFYHVGWGGQEMFYPKDKLLFAFLYLPDSWKEALVKDEHYPYNMGIFGGDDLDRIKSFANEALDVGLNRLNEQSKIIESGFTSAFVEQFGAGVHFGKNMFTLFNSLMFGVSKDSSFAHLAGTQKRNGAGLWAIHGWFGEDFPALKIEVDRLSIENQL